MEALLQSGRLVDAIIALTLLEAAALAILRRRGSHGIPLGILLPHLAAGTCLLLALRAAIAGVSSWWLAAALAAAGLAHLVDVTRLWRRFGGDTPAR